MKRTSKTLAALIAALALTVTPACQDDSDIEDAADKIEDSIEDAGDAIDDAADDLGDAVEDAADEVEDSTDGK